MYSYVSKNTPVSYKLLFTAQIDYKCLANNANNFWQHITIICCHSSVRVHLMSAFNEFPRVHAEYLRDGQIRYSY